MKIKYQPRIIETLHHREFARVKRIERDLRILDSKVEIETPPLPKYDKSLYKRKTLGVAWCKELLRAFIV